MRNRVVLFTTVFAGVVGVTSTACFCSSYRGSSGQVRESVNQTASSQEDLSKPPPLPLPPPPPPRTHEISRPAPPEPRRSLAGLTGEELAKAEQLLPQGLKIATFPLSDAEYSAALKRIDLDGDGTPEVVMVHTERESADEAGPPSLRLSVFRSVGDGSRVASARLLGNYVYTNIYDQMATPFAVSDLTGDGRPEIVVTSAMGPA